MTLCDAFIVGFFCCCFSFYFCRMLVDHVHFLCHYLLNSCLGCSPSEWRASSANNNWRTSCNGTFNIAPSIWSDTNPEKIDSTTAVRIIRLDFVVVKKNAHLFCLRHAASIFRSSNNWNKHSPNNWSTKSATDICIGNGRTFSVHFLPEIEMQRCTNLLLRHPVVSCATSLL